MLFLTVFSKERHHSFLIQTQIQRNDKNKEHRVRFVLFEMLAFVIWTLKKQLKFSIDSRAPQLQKVEFPLLTDTNRITTRLKTLRVSICHCKVQVDENIIKQYIYTTDKTTSTIISWLYAVHIVSRRSLLVEIVLILCASETDSTFHPVVQPKSWSHPSQHRPAI